MRGPVCATAIAHVKNVSTDEVIAVFGLTTASAGMAHLSTRD
jgi:hypothetical protein